VLAHGTHDLPAPTAAEAEPVLLEAARRLDPPRLRRVVTHLRWVADPDTAEGRAERQHQQRGPWLAPTFEGMVAVDGLLEPEAGQLLLAALAPLARPARATDERSPGQRRADALAELARRTLEHGQLPQTGGVRPQLTITVDLDSLLGRHPGLGGEGGGAAPLDPETCRRLACDGAVTRVLVTRHPPPTTTPTTAATTAPPVTPSPATTATTTAATATTAASAPTMAPVAAITRTTRVATAGWLPGCGRRRRCSRRHLAVPRPNRWRWAAPAPAGW
jgi:hypothetical protein